MNLTMSSFVGGETLHDVKHDLKIGFAGAILFHLGILFLGGLLAVQSVDYGVESGESGVAVELIAALPEETVPQASQDSALQEKLLPIEDSEMMLPAQVEKKPEPIQPPPEKAQPVPLQKTAVQGDGSSAIPGKDQTTFHSEAGAVAESSPDYLKNPAPVYPESARRQGWEGLVMLRALVNEKGKVVQIEIEKSSGYSILDESALETVRRWRFKPAAFAQVSLESWVRVPIRFKLTES